ncbi:hypothetical protein D9Q98_009591 [Chlorella vulgaris]|uniref:Uncharacterized protein n=1 Tax=Chlorella vulgaris TaxID=3077 RepID=A0A9D4TFG6_CHLVU|nr:hypothetical protein D9Q98_009591 [Chlorella vulgaris]
MSLPGQKKLELTETLDSTTASLVQLVIDAIKSGQKKVEVKIQVEGKLDDDGKTIELEVKIKGKEGDSKEERELEYTVALHRHSKVKSCSKQRC